MRIRPLVLALAALPFISLAAQAATDPVEGTWLTENGGAHIEIAPCGGSMCGTIIWLKEPLREDGTPKRDINNPEEANHGNPIIGLQMIKGFKKEKPGIWEDGEIYDPESGKTYDSNMEARGPDTLGVEGCVLFFCQEQTWTRMK
ncbi:MAG: DUF2147 domain-containing protein [Minwuia sp.]|nr:DUF2147 domain-containing protein [Minwuia sp.]